MLKLKKIFLTITVILTLYPVVVNAKCATKTIDRGWSKACADIIKSSEASCLPSLELRVSGSAEFSGKGSAYSWSRKTSAVGLYNTQSFGDTYSANRIYYSKTSTDVTQKTIANGQWFMYSTAWGTEDTATAATEVNLSLDDITIDRQAPSKCFMSSLSGSKYTIGGDGRFYAAPGSTVTANWRITDSGCAGASNITTSKTVPNATSDYLEAQACDKFGNCTSSTLCRFQYYIDGKGPSCSGANVTQSTTAWTRDPVTVNATNCTDSGSGFKSCTTATATKEDQTVTLYCKDKLDNSTALNHKVTNIDITAPYCTSSGTANVPAGVFVRTSMPAWATCADARSGCTQGTYYGTIFNGSTSIGISDNVGNTSSCTINFDRWDVSEPTTTITFDKQHEGNSESQYTNDAQIMVTISAKDDISGVDRVCYKLEGETTQSSVCHKGDSYTFAISNEGITKITAWSFDKAQDYQNGSIVYTTGNKSADVTKSAYIDRTKPNLSSYQADDNGQVADKDVILILKSAYDAVKDSENPWVNEPVTVEAAVYDTKYKDGSRSGIGTIEYYWGLTDNPTEVWGSAHTDKKYDQQNKPQGTVPTKPLKGSSYTLEEVAYDNRLDYTASVKNPENNETLNDVIYLHIRVCDRATTAYGQKNPNCTTGVYGPVYYDDMPPSLVEAKYPTSNKTAVNPSTDSDNPTLDPSKPVGGTGSEVVEPDSLKNTKVLDALNWTNRLVIGFVAHEDTQQSELDITANKQNSGLDKLEFYYDRSYKHQSLELNTTSFRILDNVRENCNGELQCAYYLDFNSLSSHPNLNGKYTVMEEGNRFIRVRAYDKAGNYKDFYFGPYQFDITSSKISNIKFTGAPGTIIDN